MVCCHFLLIAAMHVVVFVAIVHNLNICMNWFV